MKPLLIILTVVSSFFAKSSLANTTDVTPVVLQSFKSAFNNASEVNWSATTNFYKASFLLNGQYVAAFYNANGEMVALTRNISSFQLPLVLQGDIKKQYPKYWISDLFEIANEEGTSYYITLENADTKLVLKSGGNSWITFKKLRKL